MSAPIPRFLLPRGYTHPSTLPIRSPKPRLSLPPCRHASTTPPEPRPIRLEKPAKFNPPSHGKRLKASLPRHYGPHLTEEQKTEQATKKYPRMMPPPGTFMFWFLTSRGLHAFISLGTLVLLASFTAYENWKRATVFRSQLPDASSFFSHPIASASQAYEVWRLDVARTSAETAEKRRRGVEDVQKRSTYRKAHGLEDENAQGLGGWTAKSDGEVLGPAIKTGGTVGHPVDGVGVGGDLVTDGGIGRSGGDSREMSIHAEWEGRRRPVKKWFGIW